MKTILVSIISDQTIPNVLVIKEMYGLYDDLLFITSEYVEKKGLDKWIEMACGLKADSVKRIKVVEDDLDDVRTKLANLDCADTKYIINMSGGTKIMTIGVYEFFAKKGNKIIYVTFGKNLYKEIYPLTSASETNIAYRLNLWEYLTAYGLYYEPELKLLKDCEFTNIFFKSFRSKKFDFAKEELIINSHSFEEINDRTYFSGAWFEEYVFHKIKNDFNLLPENIGLNVELRRDATSVSHDNEYDVVFVYENQLYVIECKASVGNKNFAKDNLEKFMYKLAAITRDFGLKINSSILTLSYLDSVLLGKMLGVEKRKNILGIRAMVDAKVFLKNESLKTVLMK
ncbi:MAG: DUF1887 family CARF protein [Bacteroidales bacterium]|nr:DUF1887 family CARF protein [Bacteroidales bacterium]